MKTALLAFLVSFTAMASECFVRNVDLVTTEVSMAREICITNIDMNLEVFGNSKAVIKYTLDGVASEKTIKLNNPIERRDGKVLFLAFDLESNSAGGWCSDTTETSIDASLVMNKDGSNVTIEEVTGSVRYSYDNCHSDGREIQSIKFEKN